MYCKPNLRLCRQICFHEFRVSFPARYAIREHLDIRPAHVPHAPLFASTIMEEWVKHVKLELDFHYEVDNLQRAHKAMAASGLDVIIPKAVPEFTKTRYVL